MEVSVTTDIQVEKSESKFQNVLTGYSIEITIFTTTYYRTEQGSASLFHRAYDDKK